MALWGVSTSDESKPKWLTDEQKKTVYATDRGWVQLNGKGLEEVICAIGELAGEDAVTGIGAATITSTDFVTTSFSEAAGGNIDVRVIFNERVTVDTSGGTPTIVLTNDQAGGGSAATLSAAYQSGSSTNRLTFRVTVGAAAGTFAEDDVLSIGAQNVALNSGTIVDQADGSTAVAVAISAAAGTAAGTLTAVA
jgi:hypothetical protein